jgi:hypothetical protein
MSLVTVTSPMAALTPKVWWDDGRLCARTSMVWQVATLGSWCQEVIADPEERVVTVRRRYLWLATSTMEVPFDAISHIEYRHVGVATDWFGGSRRMVLHGGKSDGVESYSVSLALRDRDEIHLFSFQGEDSVHTGAVGVLLGDEILDVRGDQQEKSLNYVDALQVVTQKGLSSRSRPRRYAPPFQRSG